VRGHTLDLTLSMLAPRLGRDFNDIRDLNDAPFTGVLLALHVEHATLAHTIRPSGINYGFYGK